MFVLFLGLLIMPTTLKNKKDSLVKRINNAFKMFSIANFVEEYTPSKYAEKLLDEDLEVDSLSIKIQLVRDSISAVLDHLGFEEGVILKVAAAKVSQLMDAMDLFVAIAKGQKDGKDLVDLVGMIPDLTDTTNFNNKLKNTDKVKDAIDFIKDIIHPDSVVNKKPAARTSGKSTRKSKLIDPTDETLEEANDKLKQTPEGTEDLLEGDEDDTSSQSGRKDGKDDNDNELTEEGEENNKLQDESSDSLQGGEEDPKRKMSHRKNNNLATKTNILGNFVEVPTAKRVSKSKKVKQDNKPLDKLLDEVNDDANTEEKVKEEAPKAPGLKDTPEDTLETTDEEALKEDNAELQETNADDDTTGDNLHQETPVKRIPKKQKKRQDKTAENTVEKAKRMSSKKNKIRGLTRKNNKRLTPRFMSEEEIVEQKKQEKMDKNDQFSFISLREDNKNLKGKPAKDKRVRKPKAHRKRNDDADVQLQNTDEELKSEMPQEESSPKKRQDEPNEDSLEGNNNDGLKEGEKEGENEELNADTDDSQKEGDLQANDDENSSEGTGKRIRSHRH